MRTTTCLLHSRERTQCLNDRAEQHQRAHQSCGCGQAHLSCLSRSSINCRGDSCNVVTLVLCKSLVMNVLPCVLYCLRKFAWQREDNVESLSCPESFREQWFLVPLHVKCTQSHMQSSHTTQTYTEEQQTHYMKANVMYCVSTEQWIACTSSRT